MTRILLVDDHEIVRRGLKQLLADAYPQAVFGEANRVPPAHELLVEKDWALVVLDINLPGGSGLDLLTEVRRLRPKAAVLMLSSYPEEEFAIRAFKLGAAGYLTKASIAEEMLLAVAKVLAGGKYVSAALAERLATSLGSPLAGALHETLSPRELEVLRLVAMARRSRKSRRASLSAKRPSRPTAHALRRNLACPPTSSSRATLCSTDWWSRQRHAAPGLSVIFPTAGFHRADTVFSLSPSIAIRTAAVE